MRKITFGKVLDNAYSLIDSNVVELKSAMIGLCTDIERYFKIAFEINLNEEIDDEAFRRMVYVFPRFGTLTIEQVNRYVLLFVNIRNINAHLYLSKPIYVDDDLKQFIEDNVGASYQVVKERKITVYGAASVLMLMAQKYMIWPFCTAFFRHEYFVEIGKGDMMSEFQIEQQKKFQAVCGIGKPLNQNSEPISGVEFVYINDVLKRCLTLVFFDLEKSLNIYGTSGYKTASLFLLLKRNPLFDEEVISKIVRLRNCWFHGNFVGDIVNENGSTFEFTLDFAIETLKEINQVAKQNMTLFGLLVNDIGFFAQNFFNYYALRLVEVSFKILDDRLLTEDKLESRLDNMDKAFGRFEAVDPKLFEMFSELINGDEIRWSVAAAKFLDKLPRKFDCTNLKIAKIHCDNGFMIGDYKTKKTDIVLVMNKLDDQHRNLVNEHDLLEYNFVVENNYSKYISVVRIKL